MHAKPKLVTSPFHKVPQKDKRCVCHVFFCLGSFLERLFSSVLLVEMCWFTLTGLALPKHFKSTRDMPTYQGFSKPFKNFPFKIMGTWNFPGAVRTAECRNRRLQNDNPVKSHWGEPAQTLLQPESEPAFSFCGLSSQKHPMTSTLPITFQPAVTRNCLELPH